MKNTKPAKPTIKEVVRTIAKIPKAIIDNTMGKNDPVPYKPRKDKMK